jgi:hypothetical protein
VELVQAVCINKLPRAMLGHDGIGGAAGGSETFCFETKFSTFHRQRESQQGDLVPFS